MKYKESQKIMTLMIEQCLSILDDPCLKSEERLEVLKILYDLTQGRL